jgi:hypothetical protein
MWVRQGAILGAVRRDVGPLAPTLRTWSARSAGSVGSSPRSVVAGVAMAVGSGRTGRVRWLASGPFGQVNVIVGGIWCGAEPATGRALA